MKGCETTYNNYINRSFALRTFLHHLIYVISFQCRASIIEFTFLTNYYPPKLDYHDKVCLVIEAQKFITIPEIIILMLMVALKEEMNV